MAPKHITAFGFSIPQATGEISGTEIAVTVPINTDVTALIATFSHTGAAIAVGATPQVSGVTPNDFTSAVTYTVTDSGGDTQDYTVTVTVSRVTNQMIADLRRKIAEPTTANYSDETLIRYIEKYPHFDEYGESAFDEWGAVNTDWVATYDLNAAAGDVWEEKAGLVAGKFDFSANGGSYSMSQQRDAYLAQARYYRARRMPTTATLIKYPKESAADESYIGNLPESYYDP